MSRQAYVGNEGRTFREALIYELEHNYGVLGSRRVLELLAKDVEQLIGEFFPSPEHLASGWMVFTGTQASGAKIHPGQTAGEHVLKTLAWPVLLPEDIHLLVLHGDGKAARQAFFLQRLVRLIEYGQQQKPFPVLLTQTDLGLLVGLNNIQVSELLKLARQQTGKPLLTKGYFFDQGMRPSHKEEIIALYEAGLDEAEVARRSNHDQQSVGQYIRDYERVKKMLDQQIAVELIPQLIGLLPNVVNAYADLAWQNHPDRFQPPDAVA